VFCIKHGLYERLMAAPTSSLLRAVLPQRLIDVLIFRGTWWLCGLSGGLALLIEDRRRRAELAMYVLPKGLESLWVAARGQGLALHTGSWGEGVLTGLGIGMVMVCPRFFHAAVKLTVPGTGRRYTKTTHNIFRGWFVEFYTS
jgi:hypothetical protein